MLRKYFMYFPFTVVYYGLINRKGGLMRETFSKTFDSGFYIEWESPKDSLWSLYINGQSTISGVMAYSDEDHMIFGDGWEVIEYDVNLDGCSIEVFDPQENDVVYGPNEIPDMIRDEMELAMLEIVEGKF